MNRTKDEKLVFIVGNSRSGTTMMSRILDNHPQIHTFAETHFFERIWSTGNKDETVPEEEGADFAARMIAMQRLLFREWGEYARFLDEGRKVVEAARDGGLTRGNLFQAFLLYEAGEKGKKIPCEQTPRNVFYMGDIIELYPGVRIINMIRDPRDILLSQKGKWKRKFLGTQRTNKQYPLHESIRNFVNYHPVTISKLWNSSINAADRFAGHQSVHFLHFRDILKDPEKEIRSVCDFIGIPFDERMLDVSQVGSSVLADNPDKRGIDPGRAGIWQKKGGLNSAEVFYCQKITGRLMEKLGYAPVDITPNPLLAAYYILSWPFKLALALLLNLKRMKSIPEAIRRRLV